MAVLCGVIYVSVHIIYRWSVEHLLGIKKLSVPVLVQLSEDLARAVIDYNRTLRHELACSEDLKVENQLSRDFIALMLNIERKLQQQLNQCHLDDADEDDSFSSSATGEGMVQTNVHVLFNLARI